MNASSPDLPLASVVAHSECDETISVFTTETNDSTDLMAFFNKQFPEIEERNKNNAQASRRARFFQEVRTKTNIAYILNRSHDKQSTGSISPYECDSSSVANHAVVGAGQEPKEDVNEEDFYDDQDDSTSDVESTSASNTIYTGTDEEEEEEEEENTEEEDRPKEAKPTRTRRHRRRADRLEVGFRHPNRHRIGLVNSPVRKALVRVKNRVLFPNKSDGTSIDTLRTCSMNQARKFNSTELKGSPPPTWEQSRAMEKDLAQTKLELAVIQTELDHNKALLERTMEERDFLQEQYSTLQHEYQESQGMIHEYQTMVEHLKRHVRNDPAVQGGIDRPSNELSSVRGRRGLRLRACSPLRAFRPVA